MTDNQPENSIPVPYPKPGYCQICVKVKTPKPVCDACYSDGWRVGEEMMAELRKDPELLVDDNGNITVLPDYKKKWGIDE